MEEYRFQARFNWSRTQYLLALNAGLLVAGVSVAGGGRVGALVFAPGAVMAVLSLLAIHTQHDYYRAARDRMRRVEDTLNLPPDHRVDTTSTLGQRRRLVSVNDVVYLLLGLIAVAHAVGVGVVLSR